MQPGAGTDRAGVSATAVTALLWASSFAAIRSAGAKTRAAVTSSAKRPE